MRALPNIPFRFLSLISVYLFTLTACADDDDLPEFVHPGLMTQLTAYGSIDGYGFDSISYNCFEMWQQHENISGHIGNEPNFFFRQGVRFIESDSLEVGLYIFMFHSSRNHIKFTPQIFSYYLFQDTAHSFLMVEVEKNDRVYRNRWLRSFSYDAEEMENSEPVDKGEAYHIYAHSATSEGCFRETVSVPFTISYSGTLKDEQLEDSITVDWLQSRIFLFQH